jgi:hypothetical protein
VCHAGKFTGGLTERQFLMNGNEAVLPLGKTASNRRRARLLTSQDAHQAGKTSEGEADGQAVNQSKADFLTAGINGQQRPQKPAFPFDMNNALWHTGI